MTSIHRPQSSPGFAPAAPRSGRFHPVGADEVRIASGFWADRQSVNAEATLPHIRHWLEREGWLPNFDLAVRGALPGGRRGREFSDSEVYKYLEAVAWEIGRTSNEHLEAEFRSVVSRVAAAQDPDGYLNTAFGRDGQGERWSDLEWGHELYCFGHLIQAAIARERTRPGADDGLLGVARRAADLVCEAFGPDGIQRVGGHPEIEVALVELSRVTGEKGYLDQARLFIERRGTGSLNRIEWGPEYFQDDVPVRQATVLRGHAVRANYLSAGALDVAVDTGDSELEEALATQWDNTVARRTYITGGQGSHHQDEGFGEDWVLPPDRAYSETCASIGSVMFSWRLLMARGEAKYADLIERSLYNVVATSPSADGTAFYYANTLHQRVPGAEADLDHASARAESSLRAPWFDVSCCPPNVARTMASLAALIATTDEAGLQVHQYASCAIDTTLADGRHVAVRVDTAYPSDGVIGVTPTSESTEPWTLSLRVPQWAEGAELVVDVAGHHSVSSVDPGYVEVTQTFTTRDRVELRLPMRARVVTADPRVDAVRGCVAVERGPEVLCLESVDLSEASQGRVVDVGDVRLVPASVRERSGRVTAGFVPVTTAPDAGWQYQEGRSEVLDDEMLNVDLVPYHDWARRGPSTMRVWLPVSAAGGGAR